METGKFFGKSKKQLTGSKPVFFVLGQTKRAKAWLLFAQGIFIVGIVLSLRTLLCSRKGNDVAARLRLQLCLLILLDRIPYQIALFITNGQFLVIGELVPEPIQHMLVAVIHDNTLKTSAAVGFRDTCATEWQENGMPLEIISRILGHSSTTVTEKYYVKFRRQGLTDARTVIDKISGDVADDVVR